MARRTVGCFSDAKLRELAEQPNVTVYQPTHDVVFEPWPAARVRRCVDRVAALTREGRTAAEVRADAELDAFARHYLVFFQKLTDADFVRDPEHVATVQALVELRAGVERGGDATAAQAAAADLALQRLAKRV